LNSSFAGSVPGAAIFSSAGLSSSLVASTGGKAAVKGDGSNLEAFPDLSASGPFATAALYDSGSGTVGGGNVSGTFYLSFLIRAYFNTGQNAYGGLLLSRGDDTTGVLIGNSLPAWAFSLWYSPTSTSVDLDNENSTGSYLYVDTNTHVIVARVKYIAAGDDTLTAWLDPNPTTDENTQNSATTYIGTLSGDLSFNRFFLRGGLSGKQFDYGQIRFGTSWASVLPADPVNLPAPAIQGATALSNGCFELIFTGSAGQPYSIHASTNLALPFANWPIINNGTFAFGPVNFKDTNASNLRSRFYRITSP